MLNRANLGTLAVVLGVTLSSAKISAIEFFEMGLLCQEDDGDRYIYLLDADKSVTFLKLPVAGEPSVENFDSDSWEQVSENGIVLSLNDGYKLVSLTQNEVTGTFFGKTINKKAALKP